MAKVIRERKLSPQETDRLVQNGLLEIRKRVVFEFDLSSTFERVLN